MPAREPGRRWKLFRRFFRGCRIAILLVVFVVVAAGAYLNEVGLPDFLKRRLVQQLRDRGVDLQFTRLRLRWYRGVVAENVGFGPAAADETAPKLSLQEMEVRLNHSAMVRFKLQVDELRLHGGKLAWELTDSNQPPLRLSITNIDTQLRLLPGDEWQLDQLSATIAGAQLRFSGSITNASALRDWKIFRGGAAPEPGVLQQRLRDIKHNLDRVKFADAPSLVLVLHGDAKDERSFHGSLTLNAHGAETPWGSVTNARLTTRLIASELITNMPHAEFTLLAEKAVTEWGTASAFRLDLDARQDATQTNLVTAKMEIRSGAFSSPWGEAAGGQFIANWKHDVTNAVPLQGQAQLALTSASTKWGKAGTAKLTGKMERKASTGQPPPDTSNWAGWAGLEPYLIEGSFQLTNLHAVAEGYGAVDFSELAGDASWNAPDLVVTNFRAKLFDGGTYGRLALNVATRELTFTNSADLDAQKALPLLPPGGRRWLEQYSWQEPPLVHSAGALILPAWTNREPDWEGEVIPSARLRGDFTVNRGAFRGIPFNSAFFHFNYSNQLWNLPDLVATRPEGRLEMAHEADDVTHLFHFHFRSTIDVKALGVLMGTNGRKVMDFFTFQHTPEIDADLWGHWKEVDRIGARARVVASNFTFRGESVGRVETEVSYTNGFLICTDPRLERPEGTFHATGLGVDFKAAKLYLTNGFSTIEPAPFFRVIGPRTSEEMKPYQFLKPPTVRGNGVIPLDNDAVADAHFQLDGGPFHWMNFNLDHVSTGLDWVGDTLRLTDSKATAYGGRLTGEGNFDFKPGAGTDFSFNIDVTNANLQTLMADLSPGTNHLEGQLSGQLIIKRANARDWQSWFGEGNAELHDGLLWEFPAFGIFSPVLDGIWEGLGKSRANGGTATFVITNSVIHSEDLEITASTYTMRYWGTVDFEGRLNAIVEAKLLRKTPVLGPLLNIALTPLTKLFEFKVTGTLGEPKKEPIVPVVPRLLMMPFSPFQTIRDMLPPDKAPETSPPAGVK
jgi:hypothetical protein